MGKLKAFWEKVFFNRTWKCKACLRENFNGKYFCDECEKSLPLNDGYICNHCGRATERAEEYCLTCKNKLTSLDKCRSSFIYEGYVVKMIYRFKFGGKRHYARLFGDFMEKTYLNSGFSPDCIVYVPMRRLSVLKRGYNQAELLANELSERTGVPVIKDCLIKKKRTKTQAKYK